MNTSALSAFLPPAFDGRPVGLLAGKGSYPVLSAERVRRAGLPLRLIAFDGETDPRLWASVPEDERALVKVGQLGKLLKALARMDCGYALMAGQITPRKLFRGLHPDLKTVKMLNGLREKNAETIFGAIANEIETLGVRMLDARCFLDDQLAHEGLMTPGKLKSDPTHIEHGIHVAREIARLDVGQGVVVRKGTVLAVEAYEGTDPMLKRAGGFKTDGLIFVKTVKREQDYRFDVPVFGLRTLEVMAESGIHTAALASNGVLILEKEKVLRSAKKRKIELLGYRIE